MGSAGSFSSLRPSQRLLQERSVLSISLLSGRKVGSENGQAPAYRPGERRELRGVHWFRVGESEPPVGAHLVTPRRGYTHHGIHAGGCRVVHYPGLERGLHLGPLEEISIEGFACGRVLGVISGEPRRFAAEEIVRRARSRLGENRYRLFSNNCEHFCEWCLRGQQRSYQIESLLALPLRGLRAARELLRYLGGAGSWIRRPELRSQLEP